MERGINLRGFRLALKDGGTAEGRSGIVLIWLMTKGDECYDMKIAEYYATRGKLTNLDASYGRHTALTYASSEGHLDIMEALLAAGADKDKSRRSNGNTPLIHAADGGHVECLKALLDKGSDVTATNKVCDECDEQ